MEFDLRKVRPTDLVRAANSTALGPVMKARHLRDHRQEGGFRFSDGKVIDVPRYYGFIWRKLSQPARPKGKTYEQHAAEMAARSRALSLAGRDIGAIPPVKDPARREAAVASFRLFAESYFPETFSLAWSEDHKKVILRIEIAVVTGGLFALAMPRGSGKTTLCEIAAIWALLTGRARFVALLGATEVHALEMLDSLKTELEGNELLLEDFPEVCFPIVALEGIAHRCKGQLCEGERTHVVWTATEIVLPSIAGSAASGAIVKVAGITGRVRGMKFKRPADGASVRPDLVVIDDPQTDESAKSLSQSAERVRILKGAVLGLAGPGKKIAGCMPCTVIRMGDMADQILNRSLHPEWNGERFKMIYKMPERMDLWDEYREARNQGMRDGDNGEAATEFYRSNREEMDRGAVVAWPERFNHDELSALQHAMNLLFRDETAFWSEYQNEPLPEQMVEHDELTVELIANKLSGIERYEFPIECNKLTAFIDVQMKALFYTVVAWSPRFTGYVVDYGVFPDQRAGHFTLAEIKRTLALTFPGTALEGWLFAGLEKLTDAMLGRPWTRDDGAEMRIDRCMIDANWGLSTHVVKRFCRQSKHAATVIPSHGRYVGASSRPFADQKKHAGDVSGLNWRIPRVAGPREVRHVIWDTNYWKSFVARSLTTSLGDPGSLSLYGKDFNRHLLFAEHCLAEYRIKTSGRGRDVEEWQEKPGQDNHWWDCLVGAAVAASIEGCEVAEPDQAPEDKPIKLSQLQRERRRR